jgi:hypothetical protein
MQGSKGSKADFINCLITKEIQHWMFDFDVEAEESTFVRFSFASSRATI